MELAANARANFLLWLGSFKSSLGNGGASVIPSLRLRRLSRTMPNRKMARPSMRMPGNTMYVKMPMYGLEGANPIPHRALPRMNKTLIAIMKAPM
jgi:hypothetical protein